MGVFAQLISFRNAQAKLDALREFERLTLKSFTYGTIRLYNEYYKLDVEIKLLIKSAKQQMYMKGVLAPEYFDVDVEVPVEHISLQGIWQVKEKKKVYLYHYADPDIENYCIAFSDGERGVRALLKAFEVMSLRPQPLRISIPHGIRGLKVLEELGIIKRAYVRRIMDTYVKGAQLYGEELQRSDILHGLVSRGGKLTAAVIQIPDKNMVLILSERGSIYSQRKIPHSQFALELAEILKLLKSKNLIRSSTI